MEDGEARVLTVMELCGSSLEDRISDNQELGWHGKVVMLQQVALGVAYLHSHGIIHRDLKTANVLIGKDGLAKVADFGLAKKQQVDVLEQQTGNIGTPVYMAPELMIDSAWTDGTEAGNMLDVYSFGILMWAVCTRERVFERMVKQRRWNLWSLRNAIVEGTRPEVEDHEELQRAPCALVLLMIKCWQGKPSDRPTGAAPARTSTHQHTLAHTSTHTHSDNSRHILYPAEYPAECPAHRPALTT
jgi:serine/threonine protein kinase